MKKVRGRLTLSGSAFPISDKWTRHFWHNHPRLASSSSSLPLASTAPHSTCHDLQPPATPKPTSRRDSRSHTPDASPRARLLMPPPSPVDPTQRVRLITSLNNDICVHKCDPSIDNISKQWPMCAQMSPVATHGHIPSVQLKKDFFSNSVCAPLLCRQGLQSRSYICGSVAGTIYMKRTEWLIWSARSYSSRAHADMDMYSWGRLVRFTCEPGSH
jgi:hypothetical protein